MDMSSPDIPAIESLDTPQSHVPSLHFEFENTHARLPKNFYARIDPTPVAAPQLVQQAPNSSNRILVGVARA